jgi:hypothetical protein
MTVRFQHNLARGLSEFRELTEGHEFYLDVRIGDEEDGQLEAFMLNERNIAELIKSRQDVSASRVDGISYQVIKSANKDRIQFISFRQKLASGMAESSTRGRKAEQSYYSGRAIENKLPTGD